MSIRFLPLSDSKKLHMVVLSTSAGDLFLGRAVQNLLDDSLFCSEELFESNTGREHLWFARQEVEEHMLQAYFAGACRTSLWFWVARRDSGESQVSAALAYLKENGSPITSLNPSVFYRTGMFRRGSGPTEGSLADSIRSGLYLWRTLPEAGTYEVGHFLGSKETVRLCLDALGFTDMVDWENMQLLTECNETLMEYGPRICRSCDDGPRWIVADTIDHT